jgi:iron complex transport system ATP-binding protein
MKPRPPLLDFDRVTMIRGGRRVLDGLTFRIDVGENVAILGPNGSGKSSLLKLLTRELYPVTNDGPTAMRILGRETWNLFELRRHLGIVSTDLQLEFARECSGWETVLSGFFSSVGLWTCHRVTRAMEAKARQVLRRLEIEHLAGRAMTAMSTGEARRMLIGRALIHDPDALVLDEASNSLDLRALREFRATLRGLVRHGTSVILVTHALEEVIPEVSRVLLLREGRIFKDGPKKEMLTAENLSDLYRIPVRLAVSDGLYHIR